MTTGKVKLAIVVGVVVIGGLVIAKTLNKPRLKCRPGSKFTPFAKATDIPNFALYSAITRANLTEQVKKYGGACMASPEIELVVGPATVTESKDDDGQYFVTSPSMV